MFGLLILLIAQTELLSNGGLENWTGGIPDSWVKETYEFQLYPDSNNIHGGNYSGKFILRSTNTQRLTQYITSITPGNMYVYRLYVLDTDTMGKVRGYLRFYDGNGTQVASFYTSYSDNDYPDWELLQSDTFVCPQNAETLHVEIRLYDEGTWEQGDSAVFYVDDISLLDLGPAPEPPYHSISEIQGFTTSSPFKDSIVATSGIVTAVFGNNFFIEEYPGGIRKGLYIYRGSASSPVVHVGDSVLVKGTVAEYFGNTQLKNIFEVDIIDSNHPLPEPITLTASDTITEDHEGVYVFLEDAECLNDSLGYGEWEINYRFISTTRDTFLHVDDMGVSYTPTVGAHYSIYGVITFTYGFFKIEPRNEQDITFLDISESSKSTVSNTTIILSNSDLSLKNLTGDWEIYNIYGSLIARGNGKVKTKLQESGLYFLKLQDKIIRILRK